MKDSIFYSEGKKAFTRQLAYALFLDVVGILGWLACTYFMVHIMDDEEVTRIYWILTIVIELTVMIPVIIRMLLKFRKFTDYLDRIPKDEFAQLCMQAEYRYDTYIRTDEYWFIPQLLRFIKIGEISGLKPVYHYSYGMLDGIKLYITANGRTDKINVRKFRELKEDMDKLDFRWR